MASAQAGGRIRETIVAIPLQRRWGWLLALGIIQILAGMLAIAVPVVGSLAAVAVFSALLIVSAIFHIVHAFKVREWSGFALHLLGGLLFGAAGVFLVLYPLQGTAALMLAFGVLFIIDGTVKSLLAAVLRPNDGWGWILAGGLAGIVLGVLLLTNWPTAAVWVVGMLLGINLIFMGVMNASLAIIYRRAQSTSGPAGQPLHA